MTAPEHPKKLFNYAVCINNSDHLASLERHKIYRIIEDKQAASDGDLRVVDESGEDYLYPACRFVPIQLPQAFRSSFAAAA